MNNNTLSFPGLGLELNISPIAFSIGGFHVYWYGVIISLGFLLALIYAFQNAKKFGIIPDKMVDVIIGGMVGGIIGARVYYVIFTWDMYKNDLLSIFSTRSGGLAIYGGLIGALVVGGLMCKWRKVKLLPMFDLAAIGFLIGQCIGRWGNFINVEAYGGNTSMPWGMTSASIQSELSAKLPELTAAGMNIDPLMPVHPTFLYESLWCLIGFILLNRYWKKRKFDGEVFLMYTAWYGLGRFFIEGLRTDSLMLGPIRISQIVALVCAVAAVGAIVWVRKKVVAQEDERFMGLYVDTEAWQEALVEEKNKEKSKKKTDAVASEETTIVENQAKQTDEQAELEVQEKIEEDKENE